MNPQQNNRLSPAQVPSSSSNSQSNDVFKRALVIIVAVAIIGGANIYTKHTSQEQQSSKTSSNSSASSAAAKTATTQTSGGYKDGTYAGNNAETPYGNVQIEVVINAGKIADVQFLQMPSDEGHSRELTKVAEPILKQSTLDLQNAKIDFVSGATSTSYGYQESLQAALDKASSSAISVQKNQAG